MKLHREIKDYLFKADRYGILRGALAMVLFSALLTYSVLRLSYLNDRQASLNMLMESASQSAAIISGKMRLAADRVRATANAVSDFESFDDPKLLKILETDENDAMFSHFAVRLADGKSLQSNGERIASIDWTPEITAFDCDKSITVSARTESVIDGKEIFRIFAPISGKLGQDGQNRVYGVIETDSLSKSTESTGFGGKSSLMLFEKSSGNLLLDTDDWLKLDGADIAGLNELSYTKGYCAYDVFADIALRKSGYTEIETEDGKLVCAYLPAGISDWYVLQLVPKEVLFGSVEKERASMYANFVIIIGVMLMFVLWINGRVAKIKRNDESSKYQDEMRNRILATALSDTSIRVFIYYKNTDEVLFLKSGAEEQNDAVKKSGGLERLAQHENLSSDDARKLKNSVALAGPGNKVKFTLCSHRNGKEIFLRYTLVCVKDEYGDPTMVIGTARDITEAETDRRKRIDLEKFRNSVVTYKTTGIEIYLEKNRWKIMWLNEPVLADAGFVTAKERNDYDAELKRYVLPFIHPNDREHFSIFIDRLSLLEDFRRGITEKSLEYQICSDVNKRDVYEYRIVEVHLLRDKSTDEAKADIYIRNIENSDLEKYEVNQDEKSTEFVLSKVLSAVSGECVRVAFARPDEDTIYPVSFDGRNFQKKLEQFDYDTFMRDYAKRYVHEYYRNEFVEKSGCEYLKNQLSEKKQVTLDFITLVNDGSDDVYTPVTRSIYRVDSPDFEIVIVERVRQ